MKSKILVVLAGLMVWNSPLKADFKYSKDPQTGSWRVEAVNNPDNPPIDPKRRPASYDDPNPPMPEQYRAVWGSAVALCEAKRHTIQNKKKATAVYQLCMDRAHLKRELAIRDHKTFGSERIDVGGANRKP